MTQTTIAIFQQPLALSRGIAAVVEIKAVSKPLIDLVRRDLVAQLKSALNAHAQARNVSTCCTSLDKPPLFESQFVNMFVVPGRVKSHMHV